jgi:hypothetical protein
MLGEAFLPLDGGAHFDAAGDEEGELVVSWRDRRLAVVEQGVLTQGRLGRWDELVVNVWDFVVEVAAFAFERLLLTPRTAPHSSRLLGHV